MIFQSENIAELATALCAAQSELQPVPKDAAKPHLKNRYASLTAVLQAIRDVLPKHGLAVSQTMMPTDGKAHVRTTLLHKSGEWIAGECVMAPDKQGGPQGMGSAITYARRYSLAAIIGVVSEDDDDGAAAQPKKGSRQALEKNSDEGRSAQTKAASDQQRKAMWAAIKGTIPHIKDDRELVLQTLSLAFGRELSSSSELTSGEVSQIINDPRCLLEFAPTGREYKTLKAQQPAEKNAPEGEDITPATLQAVEKELTRLGVPGQLPPDIVAEYDTGDPSELTETQGRQALSYLKNMKG